MLRCALKGLGVHSETFVAAFAKLFANEKLQNDEEAADLLAQTYQKLKDTDRGFEDNFLSARSQLAEAKERLKVARRQMAVTDPAK